MSLRTCPCGETCLDVSLPINTQKGVRVWFCPACRVSLEEADGAVEDDVYVRILEGECGCHVVLRPVCLLWGGCDLQQRGQQCECPRSPGPPCVHQQAAAHGLDLEEWAAILRRWRGQPRADGEDYAGRPRPLFPHPVRTRAARVALLVTRQALGLDLWHAGDQPGDSTMGEERRRGLRRLIDLLTGHTT